MRGRYANYCLNEARHMEFGKSSLKMLDATERRHLDNHHVLQKAASCSHHVRNQLLMLRTNHRYIPVEGLISQE